MTVLDNAMHWVKCGWESARDRVSYSLTYAREERSFDSLAMWGDSIPDAFGEPGDAAPGEWVLGDGLYETDSEAKALQVYFAAALQEAVHEVLEWFRVDGRLVVNPHGKHETAVQSKVEDLAATLLEMSGKDWASPIELNRRVTVYIRDPECEHSQRNGSVMVSSHKDLVAANERGSRHASVRVCAREACIEDAKRWLREQGFKVWLTYQDGRKEAA